MARDRQERRKVEGTSERFLRLPHAILQSKAYLRLSAYGRQLLIDIAMQYNGKNNGDLAAPWRLMKVRGWKSQDTLNKAKRELLHSRLVVETRMGCRPNKATLYALTWYRLDECAGKLEMTAREFPLGAWHDALQVRIRERAENATLDTGLVVRSTRIRTRGGVRGAGVATPDVSIEGSYRPNAATPGGALSISPSIAAGGG
jgi:hypothetical protein